MRTFAVNILLVILYVLVGVTLELAGFTSPALFAFYGFVMGALSLLVNIFIEEKSWQA